MRAIAQPDPTSRPMPAPPADRRDLGLLLSVSLLFVFAVRTAIGPLRLADGGDWRYFYAAAQRLLHGETLYRVGALYVNPPLYAWLIEPLGGLAFWAARHVWTGIAYALLVLAGGLLLGAGPATSTRRRWLWASVLSVTAVEANLLFAQNTIAVVLGLALWYRWRQQGHGLLAGFALGLGLVKPNLVIGLLIVVVAQRRWRELLGLTAAAVLQGIQALLIVGPSGLATYLALSRDLAGSIQVSLLYRQDMQTIGAVLYQFLPAGPAGPLVVVGTLLTIATLVWYGGRARPTDAAAATVGLIGSLGISPYIHSYDLLVLVVPWLTLAPHAPPALRRLLVASYLAPLVYLGLVIAVGPQPGVVPLLVNAALAGWLLRHPAAGARAEG